MRKEGKVCLSGGGGEEQNPKTMWAASGSYANNSPGTVAFSFKDPAVFGVCVCIHVCGVFFGFVLFSLLYHEGYKRLHTSQSYCEGKPS